MPQNSLLLCIIDQIASSCSQKSSPLSRCCCWWPEPLHGWTVAWEGLVVGGTAQLRLSWPCVLHTKLCPAQGGKRLLWNIQDLCGLSSELPALLQGGASEPWHKGSEGVPQSVAAQGPFSRSPTPWGASKALCLPFELLVQTSLSSQRETLSKTLVVHPLAIESGCNKLVPGWHRGSR